MTYKYDKKDKKWIGFCDECEKLFEPKVIAVSKFVKENDGGGYKKEDFEKTNKSYVGYCETCLKNGDAHGIMENIKSKTIGQRKFGKVIVV
jgi:hypothetical protein